jgi:hypothetical protein
MGTTQATHQAMRDLLLQNLQSNQGAQVTPTFEKAAVTSATT